MQEPAVKDTRWNGSSHHRLIYAGWSYRTNADRGWVIYRDPATGLWHPRNEAIRILDGADGLPEAS